MKKILFRATAIFLVAVFALFSLASCNTAGNDPNENTDDKQANAEPDKRVAFTFDDGPTPGVTDKILDKLEELGGHATFFQVGNRHNYVENATYARIASLGCEVGTHTWSHPGGFGEMSLEATREQLEKSCEAICGETGQDVILFRPVGGASTKEQRELAAKMGLHTIHWSLDTEDWREQTNNVEKVEAFIEEKVNYIINNVEDGDIILMHELYESSYQIFSRAAERLVEMGYELVTVSELLGIDESSTPTSKTHFSAGPTYSPDAVG